MIGQSATPASAPPPSTVVTSPWHRPPGLHNDREWFKRALRTITHKGQHSVHYDDFVVIFWQHCGRMLLLIDNRVTGFSCMIDTQKPADDNALRNWLCVAAYIADS